MRRGAGDIIFGGASGILVRSRKVRESGAPARTNSDHLAGPETQSLAGRRPPADNMGREASPLRFSLPLNARALCLCLRAIDARVQLVGTLFIGFRVEGPLESVLGSALSYLRHCGRRAGLFCFPGSLLWGVFGGVFYDYLCR